VRTCIGREEILFVVSDEGPGFRSSQLPDPEDPANLERVGGRGLLLMRAFMDHVEHNPTGNQVTMARRPGQRTSAAARS
jgi:anti-sigma regulatory factor (Ser/Thr protein kinase)